MSDDVKKKIFQTEKLNITSTLGPHCSNFLISLLLSIVKVFYAFKIDN